MRYEETPFRDREDAGRRLAEQLAAYRDENLIVLALPRGGVPVGYEISRTLDAPLDIFLARKLGAPGQPEFGIGAVAQGGVRVLNEHAVRSCCAATAPSPGSEGGPRSWWTTASRPA